MDPRGKTYYCIAYLDGKVDYPESRITSDVDLFCQFGLEFIFGGVLNPGTGVLHQLSVFTCTFYVSYTRIYNVAKDTTSATMSVVLPILLFFAPYTPTVVLLEYVVPVVGR